MTGKYGRLALIGCAVATLPAAAALAGEGEVRTGFEQFIWPGGGVIGILLLALNVLSIALIVQYLIGIRRSVVLPEALRGRIAEMFTARSYREAIELTRSEPSFLSAAVHAALLEGAQGLAAMTRAMEEAVEERTTRLLRRVEVLNIIGNIAPMLGLMGTVLGMILAFEEIVRAGGVPEPARLADDIGLALVTTFWGLVVAVPALAAYSFLRNRIDGLAAETALTAQELLAKLRPAAAAKPANA